MTSKQINKNNVDLLTNTLASNAIPHVFCCWLPNALAQTMTGIGYFMHSVVGMVTVGALAPLVAAWLIEPQVRKGVDKVQAKFFKNKEDVEIPCTADSCDHNHDKIKSNPTQWQWWKENKKSLIFGYALQAMFFGYDAYQHTHHDDGHDHHNHQHSHQIEIYETSQDTTINHKKILDYARYNLT